MIQFGFLTLDVIILLAIFIFTFFVAYKKSKKSVARFVIPFYVATFVYSTLPFKATEASAKVLLFLVVYAILIFLMKRSITAFGGGYGGRHILDSIMLAFSAIFSLFIAYYKILPLDKIININFPFSAFILDKIPYYVLILIPLALIYASNSHSD
ncbi:MAG: hypothetical protein RLZZ517_38 [Candidatus Parcubacteria bacterium]|jgi:hypothetical protein